MASSMSSANPTGRRVRGITKGKSTAQIFKQVGQKIPVKVDEQFNAFVVASASRVATALGIEIRKKSPVEGVSKWGDINQAKKDQVQPKFSKFFQSSHKRSIKKGGDWIDRRCEEDFVALEQLENELVTIGEEVIAPEELSQTIFGKKNYLQGLGSSMKASSKLRLSAESNKHLSDELHTKNIEIESLRNMHQEYEERFESQEVMIESQNKKIEELLNRNTRFINMFLGSGSLTDLISSQGTNLT